MIKKYQMPFYCKKCKHVFTKANGIVRCEKYNKIAHLCISECKFNQGRVKLYGKYNC